MGGGVGEDVFVSRTKGIFVSDSADKATSGKPGKDRALKVSGV